MAEHSDLTFTPATELRDLIRSRRVSPVEILESVLARGRGRAAAALPVCDHRRRGSPHGRAGRRRGRHAPGAARSTARHPHFDQGPRAHPRPAHNVRLKILRTQCADVRQHRGGTRARGRRDHLRQDEYAQLRAQRFVRQPAHAPHAQPVEDGSNVGRLEWWRGGGRRGWCWTASAWQRRGRLDPYPGHRCAESSV